MQGEEKRNEVALELHHFESMGAGRSVERCEEWNRERSEGKEVSDRKCRSKADLYLLLSAQDGRPAL